jgi:hypothetical protein
MRQDPIQVLKAARHLTPQGVAAPRLLIAGATGALGSEVLRRLVGSQRFSLTQVLAREPMRAGLRGVQPLLVPEGEPAHWPHTDAFRCDTAVVLFDPPRLFYDRERALWTPDPAGLPELAGWLHACGARTLAIVLPHAQGRLPEALKRGLASMDEQAVAALRFERLLILRSPEKPRALQRLNLGERVARFMLSGLKYMVPGSEQPVRAAKVAQLLDAALRLAPPGTHVAAPETVWRASQGDLEAVARDWLGR